MKFWAPREDVERKGAAVQLGCADIACLRALPTSRLFEVHNDFWQPAFGTRVLPISPEVAQDTGRTHRMPVLVGSTHDEVNVFMASVPPVPDAAYRQVVAGQFGEPIADEVVARYPLNGNGDGRDELAAALTDRLFACLSHVTRQRLGHRMPVSGYEFADRDVPMIVPDTPPFPGGYGAYHASELPMLFEFPDVSLTAGQRELSDYMITAWGRFARTGDPGWRAGVQSLAAGAVRPTEFVGDHRCEFWGQQ